LRNNRPLFFLLSVIFAIFVIGVINLFQLRFEAGDVYPAYSSLRSDPLGTRVFFESLDNLEKVSVNRNHRSLSGLISGRDTTVLYFGAHPGDMDFVHKDFLKALDRFLLAGGRLVISFFPVKQKALPNKIYRSKGAAPEKKGNAEEKTRPGQDRKKSKGQKQTQSGSEKTGNQQKGKEKPDLPGKPVNLVSPGKHWGIALGYNTAGRNAKKPGRAIRSLKNELPVSISWHSTLYFHKLEKPWRVIYTHAGQPVIIKRSFGRGTLVLSSDSFLFSNEALLTERHPELLSWFIGPNSKILFDETHLGIQESLGMVGLARKYGLHWIFAVLVLLAGLFVWKNSLYFVPPLDESSPASGGEFVSERDYAEGLVSLLRRNISTNKILNICVEEWGKSRGFRKMDGDERLEKMRAVLKSEGSHRLRHGDPVRAYKTICVIVSEKIRR